MVFQIIGFYFLYVYKQAKEIIYLNLIEEKMLVLFLSFEPQYELFFNISQTIVFTFQ